jgi:hypothetical protein
LLGAERADCHQREGQCECDTAQSFPHEHAPGFLIQPYKDETDTANDFIAVASHR